VRAGGGAYLDAIRIIRTRRTFMKTGMKSLTELAQEIERRSAAKKDFIAPVARMQMIVDIAGANALYLDGSDRAPMAVNDLAHGQLAEYVGIPRAYYQRMQAQDPGLLSANVNRWLHDQERKDDKRMIRTLDGNVRAMLSNKYRPLENEDLAQAVLPVLLEEGFMILSSEITERRLYIKAVDQRIVKDIPSGKHMGDGGHTIFDTVSPGITISNSEVGYGALSIESSIFTRACTNLALFGSVLRKYHTGQRAELSDEVYALLTDQTKRATDAALWGQVRDLVAAALSETRFDQNVAKLTQAAADPLPADDIVQVIEFAGKKLGLIENERKGVLRCLIEGGDLSRYGLHSAITRHSADLENYDRATELERMGGQVIEMSQKDYAQMLRAA
jgi:hypothetical protein